MKNKISTPTRSFSNQASKVSSALSSYLNILKHSDQKKSLSPSPSLHKSNRPSPSLRKDFNADKFTHGDKGSRGDSLQITPKELRILQPRNSNLPDPDDILDLECKYHPGKKAKYSTSENPNCKFCSKCAITFALEGKRVIDLENIKENESLNNKKFEPISNLKSFVGKSKPATSPKHKALENFLGDLKANKENCEDYLNKIHSRNYDMSEYNTKQVGKVNSFFENLHKIIETQRVSVLNELDHHQEDSGMKLSMIEQKLVSYMSEMKNIKDDIENNMENILRNMEFEPLLEILERYQEKLSEYNEAYSIVEEDFIRLLKAKVPLNMENDSEVKNEIEAWLESWIELKEGKLSIVKRKRNLNNETQSNASMYISFEHKDFFDMKNSNIMPEKPLFPQSVDHYLSTTNNSNTNESNLSPNIRPMNARKPSSECAKYVNLLERINTNQANNNEFYSDLMKRSNISRDNNDSSELGRGYQSNEQKFGLQMKDNFSNFIEKKLNDGKMSTPTNGDSNNYQKTLFSSPTFKEDGM